MQCERQGAVDGVVARLKQALLRAGGQATAERV
jgi:hypothetical protein